MPNDLFDAQMEWVSSLAGDDQIMAGMVVSWQAITTTLNELVTHFNDVTFVEGQEELKHHRQVQLKKVIIGMIYELDECLDAFAGALNARKLLDDKVKDLKKAFKTECKKIGMADLKQIRNEVAFHFTKLLNTPVDLVKTYKLIDSIQLESLRETNRAAFDCGYAMRGIAIRNIREMV